MVRVKAFVNGSEKKLLSSKIKLEGDRAIDESCLEFPANVNVDVSDKIRVLQDCVNLCCMVGAYLFQGIIKDESGQCNNSVGANPIPRTDAVIYYCNSCCTTANCGFRDLVITENGCITCSTGKLNTKAMCFNGTCDYLTLNLECVFDMDKTTPVSVAFWVKTCDTSVPIVSKKSSSTCGTGWEVKVDSCGKPVFRLTSTACSNEILVTGDTAVNCGCWNHIAFTYSGIPCATNVTHYLNGSCNTFSTCTDNLSCSTLNCANVAIAAYCNGNCKANVELDDVRIWVSKTLSNSEIRSVYNKAVFNFVDGKFGCALRFNGSETFGEICYTTDHDFTGEFDILVWAKWSTCNLGYIYARRTLSGNGFALAVNRICSGDIVAEIDGNLIKTCGETFNDDSWHLIRVYRDSSNVVHLEVDKSEKNTANVASNMTLTSPALFIGTNHNKTSFFNGDINMLRIYNGTSLSSKQANRIHDSVKSTTLIKLGGRVVKVNKKIVKKSVRVLSFGEQLGITEVRAEEYFCRTPEFIIEDLILNNTCLIPHFHGTCSGIVLERFNADGKLIDIIRDLTQLSAKQFHSDGVEQFHLHDSSFRITTCTFTHGPCGCIQNFESIDDDTEVINDLVVVGERRKFSTTCKFSGDGSTTCFTLCHAAISGKVLISCTEQTPEEDYEFCVLKKTVKFCCAPACGCCNIQVDYTYELPLLARGQKQSSIDSLGRHSKRLVMPWLRTRKDAIRFISGYLNRFKEIRTSYKVTFGVIKNKLQHGDVVRLINNVKCVSDTFVIKSITHEYPEYKTEILVGEFRFDDLEYESQIAEKIHDLESAVSEIKEIRCSEQLEEVLGLCDSFNIIEACSCGTLFVECLSLSDSFTITVTSPGIYNQSTYGGGDIYGTEQDEGGFTQSGFTCSGFVTS